VIGHSGTADLVLDDQFVSRRHALVTVGPTGQVTIRDLNSTGGTFVNDERIGGPHVLQPGDLVRFADLVTRFEPAGQAGPAGPDSATAVLDRPTQVLPAAREAAPTLAAAAPEAPAIAQPPAASVVAEALPVGNGGGNGNGNGHPPVPTVQIGSLTVPGATVGAGTCSLTGAGPGVLVTVQVYVATFYCYSPSVTFLTGGARYSVVCDSTGLATYGFRAYQAETVAITATPFAMVGTAGRISGDSATVDVQVNLSRTTPELTVSGPQPGTPVGVGSYGGNVPVTAVTADQSEFGGYQVTAEPDAGITAALTPLSATEWSGTPVLRGLPLGPRSLTVTCSCTGAPSVSSSVTVAVTAVDVEPPTVAVSVPELSGSAIVDPATGTIQVKGSAADALSGMVGGSAKVAVALSVAGPQITVTPGSPGNWSAWSVELPVPGFGPYTLYVWGTDAAGNTTPAPLAWPFEAISSYVPPTLQDRLSDVEYLAALMQFARDQVTAGAAGAVSASMLAGVLGQPLDSISVPGSPAAAAAQTAVNELRVPAEILRAYIAAGGIASTTQGAAGQAAYLSAAYQALLSGVGTSYAELRLARGANDQTRQALAARIGISLSGSTPGQPRPDQLDTLTLDGPALTEAALEALFGLPATTAGLDPFRAIQPLLLTWQTATQRSQWQAEDAAPPAPVGYAVIVDPDIITSADVLPVSPATAQIAQVGELLTARGSQLAAQASALQGLLTGTGTAAAQLAALLGQGLPGVDLAALQAQDQQGTDISGQLAAAGLDRTGFAYLTQLLALAGTGLVDATEWATAVDALVGSFRRRQYPTWAAQETGIVLSPDIFQLTDTGPTVSPYRIDPLARASWQATLRTRTIQRQALTDAMSGLVASTEQATRGLLRDALLFDIAAAEHGPDPTAADIEATAVQLAGHYQVDFTVNGAQSTTRLAVATASLQALLLLIRSGDNTSATGSPASGWSLSTTEATFDSAWAWLGTAASWQSAITTFLFPEAALDPSVLQEFPPDATSAFPTAEFLGLCQELALSIGPPDPGTFAAYQTAATSRLRGMGVLGPTATLSYLNDRSLAVQNTLAGWSSSVSNGAAGRPADRDYAREVFWAVPMLVGERLHAAGQYQAALDWLWVVFPYNATSPQSSYDEINGELVQPPTPPDLTFPPDWTSRLNPFQIVGTPPYRPYPYVRSTLLAIISCLADYADSEFSAYTAESVAHARDLYGTAARLLALPSLQPIQPSSPGEPALLIPQLQTLADRVTTQQAKLRQDRDIAGLQQAQAVSAGNAISQPTPYYFKVLLARAEQLAQQAATIEAEYLSALEKYDNKTLQVSDARNAASVAGLQLSVHAAQVQEAADAVTAATAQQTKASTMVTQYTNAINAPPNQYEQALLSNYSDMQTAQDVIAGADAAIGIAQSVASTASMWDTVTSFGVKVGTAATEIAGYAVKAAAQIWANNLQAQAQANQLQASIEDRQQQWQIELASANQDGLIAAAQVTVASDQQAIAVADQGVATAQNQQAQATLLLLTTQFTNPDLYKWMSDTLGGVYRYFLQLATATARLAQAQLAFERAEPPQTFVRIDYWQPPAQLASATLGDTRGMTGAEQLAEDLAQLDNYAFSADTRRLNVSQTFSLSQLLPVEFIGFLSTGQLSFATPMAWFDQDFPGHYQRLIRQVSVSLVALVPPTRGIRATLSSSGISQVITASSDGTFGPVTLRRDPSAISFTSPANATGVFQVDLQPNMLLPFEGSGVDTTWDFSLPPTANPFDFRSISDFLVTIDYTALADNGYQAQVIRSLNADLTRSADCVFSLTRDFPDQWYALNNPPPGQATASTVLTLTGANFPVNIAPASLASTQLAVQLSGSAPLTPVAVTLSHGSASGTAVTDVTGVVSTRRGAAAWDALTGSSPVGDWALSFDSTGSQLFQQGLLSDLLLIVSWTGQAPAWST
jgi:hypothetical protein